MIFSHNLVRVVCVAKSAKSKIKTEDKDANNTPTQKKKADHYYIHSGE